MELDYDKAIQAMKQFMASFESRKFNYPDMCAVIY